MKTYQPKKSEIKRNWHLLDAKGQILGRLATQISGLLLGKGKASFSKHLDCGDFVVVTNVEKVVLSGKKETQKKYFRHSGYPGGFKEATVRQVRARFPERILEKAVFGMLPGNRLRSGRMARLKLIVGDKNPFKNEFENKNG